MFGQKRLNFPIPLDNQSIVIDENEGIRCSAFCKDGKLVNQVKKHNISNVHECFLRGLSITGDGPCMGVRKTKGGPYSWMSFKEVHEGILSIGSAYMGLMKQSKCMNPIIGIYASNSPEWVIADEACFAYSMANVPLYDTLGDEALVYTITQSALQVLVIDTDIRAKNILEKIDQLPTLKYILMIGELTEKTQALVKGDLQIISWKQAIEEGKTNRMPTRLTSDEELATLSYTSGSTGLPKGVMLSHCNILNMCLSAYDILGATHSGYEMNASTVHISYLPAAHMYERAIQKMMLFVGGRIGFYSGVIEELIGDIQELKPTLFCVVPRLLNKLYSKIMSGVGQSTIKSKMVEWAVKSKLADIKKGIIRRNSMWDYLVFNKIQQLVGGRVKIVVTGSAPVSGNILDFFRCALGCLVFEGYGQTECTAAVTVTSPGDYTTGHVGGPITCNYVKLIDVPDMGLSVKRDHRGEICVKGFNVTKGYYKQADKTKELIDTDGWAHSGDVGMWNESGCLCVVDRCKHIFKLSQGEYVAPEKIENIYTVNCSLVAQIFVDGNSLNSYIVAVVVPDFEVLIPTAQKMGISGDNLAPAALCKNNAIRDAVLAEIQAVGKAHHLKGFEQAKAIYLYHELFSISNDLLTPTMKSKRANLRKHFASNIAALYDANNV